MVCSDATLARLDLTLSKVYAKALAGAVDEHPPRLRAEQRGWIKGRDDCWKSDDARACVDRSYRRRIAELQARYRLVQATGPVRYACDGNPANAIVATYFATDPPTLIAERGDRTSVMFGEATGSGAKYVGRNEQLWEHQGDAAVRWGDGQPELHCIRQP
jgi:uncharacterized protein